MNPSNHILRSFSSLSILCFALVRLSVPSSSAAEKLNVLSNTAAGIGIFESATDVGKIDLPGSSEYFADKATYRITGSGKNIWFAEDACQFLSKTMFGDPTFSMDVAWEAEGKEPHRKACAMVRQTLDADSPYVDVAVYGDGLIEMQYRTEKGATTLAARTPIQAPAHMKLERDGDVFKVYVSKDGGPFHRWARCRSR